jgi:hypothetical protein
LPYWKSKRPPPRPLRRRESRKHAGGVRTQGGKNQSRRNSLKWGLRAQEVFPETLALAIDRVKAELTEQFRPATPYQVRLVGEMAKCYAKLDLVEELKEVNQLRVRERAELCWDSDQREIIDKLAARLAKDPARISRALGRTKQGADWLVETLEGLGLAVAANGRLDEPQHLLLLDVVGVAAEFRNGGHRVPFATNGPALAAFIQAHVTRLREIQETSLLDLDEAQRQQAMAGMPPREDAETRQLRRVEVGLRNDLRWAHAELMRVQEEAAEWSLRECERGADPDWSMDIDVNVDVDRAADAGRDPSPQADPAPDSSPMPPQASGTESESPAAAPAPAAAPSPALTTRPVTVAVPAGATAPRGTLKSYFFPDLPQSGRARRAREKQLRKQAQRAAHKAPRTH